MLETRRAPTDGRVDKDRKTRALRPKLDCLKPNLDLVWEGAHRQQYETDVTTCTYWMIG